MINNTPLTRRTVPNTGTDFTMYSLNAYKETLEKSGWIEHFGLLNLSTYNSNNLKGRTRQYVLFIQLSF